ncbi:MAG: phosphatidylserine decarboxylase [Deltaproteobacteria bacterium]|nr:phosphatidylserine decarboxylase [Deltaproteobacteria bacterium]
MIRSSRLGKLLLIAALGLGLVVYVCIQAGYATDQFYSTLVKDPERTIPSGDVVVSPADGTVLYVRRFSDGRVPLAIKNHTAIPIESFHKVGASGPREGVIVGIYMTTYGVHVNRAPIAGRVTRRAWFNGPDVDMSRLEKGLVLRAMIPAPDRLLDLVGLSISDLIEEADYVLDSARETLVIEGATRCFVVRIADYYVGQVLTWVAPGDSVETGQRIGMITWGSQTDLVIETPKTSKIELVAREGDHVRAGESVVARIR